MRVYYPNPPGDDVLESLQRAVGPEFIVSKERPEDYDVIIEGRATEDMMAPSLRTLIVPFAGVSDATLGLLRKNPQITGYNLHHNASDTAEVALGLLFAAAKLIVPMDQRLRQNDWGLRYKDNSEVDEGKAAVALEGKTAVLLGYGNIGQRVARVLLALGMDVIAVRRRGTSAEGVQTCAVSRLHEVLPQGQVLMIALPQTDETKGLIGAEELALMPRGSILVNIARGPIVDEEALFNALKSRHLHSAGLDVWYNYPSAADSTVPGYFSMPEAAKNTPPSRFPFGELDNVVMSPHRGGTSMDTEIRRVRDLAEILFAIARGDAAPNRIDLEAGY